MSELGPFKTQFAENIFKNKYSHLGTWEALSNAVVDDVCGTLQGTREPLLSKDERTTLAHYINTMKFIPGGRYLYYAGRSIHAWNNCLAGETRVLADTGWVELRNCVGSTINVLSPVDGKPYPAKIINHGLQQLNKIKFRLAGTGGACREYLVRATRNHHWPLVDGADTYDLRVGDVVPAAALPVYENLGFLHGVVFGNGTKQKERSDGTSVFQLRLCGEKASLLQFLECILKDSGIEYTVHYPTSYKGDPQLRIWCREDLKALPLNTAATEYVGAFIRGWLRVDGCASARRMHSAVEQNIDYFVDNAPKAGIIITGNKRSQVRDTKFKQNSVMFYVNYAEGSGKGFKVLSIEPDGYEDVYCPFEPVHSRLIIDNGIDTYNCYSFDAVEDTRQEWSRLLKSASDALMLGGGIGVCYSALREKGRLLARTGGKACLPGDTVVYRDSKHDSTAHNSVTISNLYKLQESKKGGLLGAKLRSLDEETGSFYRNTLIKVIYNGIAPVYKITTSRGYTIEATYNHRFMVEGGEYQEVQDLSVGDKVAVNGNDAAALVRGRVYKKYPCLGCRTQLVAKDGAKCSHCRENVPCPTCTKTKNRKADVCKQCFDVAQTQENASEKTARQRKDCIAARKDFCELCGASGRRLEVHHIDKNPLNNASENLVCLCVCCHNNLHKTERKYGDPYKQNYVAYDTITSIELVGEKEVFDLQMEAPNHNFVANGFVSHNSGPIPLMRSINEHGRNVMQGGSRRSAIYASLHWWHPDVHEFLTIKNWADMKIGNAKRGALPYTLHDAKFDDFNFPAPLDMTNISVNYDDGFLYNGNEDVFLVNCRQALSTGEPGFSFNFGKYKDEYLRNACCEFTSTEDSDICNLGSVNLGNVENIEELRDVVNLSTKFLLCGSMRADLPGEKFYDVREKSRRVGLGLMGVHEWLLRRNSNYTMTSELRDWLSVYRDYSDAAAVEFCSKHSISPSTARRAIAPTGTIGIMASTTTGIEPLFATAFKRRYLVGGSSWKYEYVVDATTNRLVQELGMDPTTVETALSLAPMYEQRIAFQADVQDFVDMAISSTINLPAWGSEFNNPDVVKPFAEVVARYRQRLRGLTCYPDGSRGGQPLTQVDYNYARKHKGVVFDEVDICDISGSGGSCGV